MKESDNGKNYETGGETNFETPRKLRDQSTLRKQQHFEDFVMKALGFNAEIEPEIFAEAINSNEKLKWQKAMNSEMQSLEENKTWKFVTLPPGEKALPCK